MSVRAFVLSRVHCFRSEVSLHIAPLTLVYGANNAGKSTLLRAMMLLASSVGRGSPASLDLSCEAARGASFRDIKSRIDSVNEVAFGITFGDGPVKSVKFRFMEEIDGSHSLRDLVCADETGEVFELRISVDQLGEYEIIRDKSRMVWSGNVTFAGIRPENVDSVPEPYRQSLIRVAKGVSEFHSTLTWLAAIRATVPRKRPIPHQAATKTMDGAWVLDHLARESMMGKRELLVAVSRELETMFDCALHVDIDERDALFRGTPGTTQWRFPLADMGEGVTQVLPVIALCCMAERGDLGHEPILCIEQPEMHLHESAEHQLAAFFARITNSAYRPRLVLETHSDILLSALMLEVAEGRLPQENVALHWVSRESSVSESRVDLLQVDARGNPQGWPIGAFGERAALARALFLARRR